jgi:hypothetical protein
MLLWVTQAHREEFHAGEYLPLDSEFLALIGGRAACAALCQPVEGLSIGLTESRAFSP